jgi:hypothetical protein
MAPGVGEPDDNRGQVGNDAQRKIGQVDPIGVAVVRDYPQRARGHAPDGRDAIDGGSDYCSNNASPRSAVLLVLNLLYRRKKAMISRVDFVRFWNRLRAEGQDQERSLPCGWRFMSSDLD